MASVELAFNAVDFHYLGAHYREGGEELWKIRRVLPNNGRLTVIGGEASWDDAKDAFDTYWEAHCEEQRAILATSAYGKDVVDDQPGESPVARLSFPAPWRACADNDPDQSRLHRFAFRVRRNDRHPDGHAYGDSSVGRVGAMAP